MSSNGEDKSGAYRRMEILESIPEGVRGVVREELRAFLEDLKASHMVTTVTTNSELARSSPTKGEQIVRRNSLGEGTGGVRQSFRAQNTQGTFCSSVSYEDGVDPVGSTASGEVGEVDIDARTRHNFAQQFKQEQEPEPDVRASMLVSGKSFLESGKSFLRRCHGLREPAREGLLARVVQSKTFDGIAAWVITFNCVFMVHAANLQVEDPSSEHSHFVRSMEMFFLAFYTLEVFLKIAVHRLFYFWNKDLRWNMMDFCLVVYGYFDLATSGRNLTWLRSLRLFKMAKVLRVLRIVRSLKELRLILSCLMSSVMNLFWSIVMIAIIVFMFSLVFVQETAEHLGDLTPEEREEAMDSPLYTDFGNVQKSMLSLYAAATGGQDWQVFYFSLQPTGSMSCSIFLFFIAFIQIALVNILTGIFVEKALKRALPDRQTQAREHVRMVSQERDELRKLCEKVDEDQDNTISPKEFYTHRSSKRLKEYLKLMGLDGHDVKALFELLSGASEDKKVPIDVFVRACMRLRTGSSVDIQRLMCEWTVMMGHVRQMEDNLKMLNVRLEEPGEPRSPRSPRLPSRGKEIENGRLDGKEVEDGRTPRLFSHVKPVEVELP